MKLTERQADLYEMLKLRGELTKEECRELIFSTVTMPRCWKDGISHEIGQIRKVTGAKIKTVRITKYVLEDD